MKRIVADINQPWENLSNDHETLTNRIDEILDKYMESEELEGPSFLVAGVFGAGKTLLMIHIFKRSLSKGLLPLYLLAEDIFRDISGTPGDLKRGVNNFTLSCVRAFKSGDYEGIKTLIRAEEGELKNDLLNVLRQNQGEVKHIEKEVLLVDEVEDEYKRIKAKVGPDPLRLWLEDRSSLKFLSLTPSGAYDLGGADEGRLQKLTIPPVSIEYIRAKLGLLAGKANALWWLSRGVPRHIIKNYQKIKDISEIDGEFEISQTLSELDHIGKPPGRVPAVELPTDHSKIRHLIDLQPWKVQAYKGFRIDKDLSEGKLSNIFQQIFDLSDSNQKRELALLISHYFKLVAMTLSDDNFASYLKIGEISEFMNLSLDILLENEFKSPTVEENMSLLFRAHEKFKDSSTLVAPFVASQIEGLSYTDVEKELPFEIKEVRRLFPPYMANPVVKSDPEEVIEQVKGKGKPVCKADENTLFFASYRDLEEYIGTDDFKSKVLPDEKYLIVLLPEEEFSNYERVIKSPSLKNELLLKWLNENSKVKVVKMPSALKLFSLSLYGYENRIPFDVQNVERQIRASQELLSQKKFELHYSALRELIEDAKPIPRSFLVNKIEPKGMKDVWGASQIGEDDVEVAVAGLAQSFLPMSSLNRSRLISLRELFRTKDRRGKLADIKVGQSLPTLSDDLLPRKDRSGKIVDAPSVDRLKGFWDRDERENLGKLAFLLPLEEFEKLHPDPNYKRIVRAFWKATREEFDVGMIDDLRRRVNEMTSKIGNIQEVEKKARKDFGLGIIFSGDDENAVKSLEGLRELIGISFDEKLPNYILQLYFEATLKRIESSVNALYRDTAQISSKLKSLETQVNEVINSIKDKKESLDFIKDKISYGEIKQEIEGSKKIDNDLSLADIETELSERLSSINTIVAEFGEAEIKLSSFKEKLSIHHLLEV